MKMILFASAMALSTVAVAQTTPAPTTTPDASAPATPDSTMAPAATPDASTPPASAPMTPDASTPPAATPDASTPPATGDNGMASGAATADDSNLPMCSKTVTDKCKQGGKGMSHGHKAMHHKKK